jgi:hypothetical protein
LLLLLLLYAREGVLLLLLSFAPLQLFQGERGMKDNHQLCGLLHTPLLTPLLLLLLAAAGV